MSGPSSTAPGRGPSGGPGRLATRSAPIRQATMVRSGREHTFEVFVRRIGDWWPTRPFSQGQDRVVEVHVEPELGGRVYETWDDGSEVDWGRVIGWDPPARFAMTWEVLPAVTEVEIRFLELGPALTRVELEHRGWERLTAEQIVACTTVEGGYREGWRIILGRLAALSEETSEG